MQTCNKSIVLFDGIFAIKSFSQISLAKLNGSKAMYSFSLKVITNAIRNVASFLVTFQLAEKLR